MAARRYGRRLRRGAAGTAVAAAAMAALSASQAPGFLPVAHAAAEQQDQPPAVTPPPGPAIDGGSPYITDLPPLNTPTGPPLVSPTTTPGGPSVNLPGNGVGLPATVLAAYQRAEASVRQTDPGCHLPWQLLAAIGQVESGQARHGSVDANGTTYSPILGPVLNGDGFADISDTDGGRYDGDPVHDRAVGPMQFIPSTWEHWGVDGNGDGVDDPNNVYDAALAAAHYLCADGRDLAVPQDMDRAILGYNHSQAYLDLVKAWYNHFMQGGAVSVPDNPGGPGTTNPLSPTGTPSAPPTPPGSTTPAPGGTPAPSVSRPPAAPGTPPGKPSTPPTTGEPSSPPTTPPTTDPTTPPTTDPTDPPTTPGCTPTPTPTPTDSATPTPTDTPTDDPCATPTPTDSATPTPADSGAPTTEAVTPTPTP
ncbi:lytic transglycosylase domain-containing protein [Actinacidiphila bryophytorum]|uniref:Membrane-bound lytic murein transglycosylase B n=1 Tax=Actinacidiphila bryophytorum TaxID=1436133 RepID=A0A9W4GZR5_9ACTN|nr:lytic transglycosylase domain-containing protein [Actinacidiphila bryophytorum]MBM9436184.1 lytic transglycosylase domain-containing protein [Actinacidiphila bryophytorum]MBN6546344.1 lytic transglycosylase domain-containing protein [Actinacidiphila bryophytorum]CAG7633377.1 Membrane-bound lytic murein transglycosylase B [Actinacidiphila bryophytorum]